MKRTKAFTVIRYCFDTIKKKFDLGHNRFLSFVNSPRLKYCPSFLFLV